MESDLLPAVAGLFLGSDTFPWDGSKLINLPTPSLPVYFGGFGVTQGANALRGYPLNGYVSVLSSTYWQTPMMDSGKFDRMMVYVPVNTLTYSCRIDIRINGVATSLDLTIPAGGTGISDSGLVEVPVNENDLVYWEIETFSGTGTIYLCPLLRFIKS